MKRYLFAKYLKHLSVEALMETVSEIGLDGPTALIREGYWMSDARTLERDLQRFVKAAEAAGIEVQYASTSFAPEDLIKDPTPLKVLAQAGLRTCRLGYMRQNATPDPRDLADRCRIWIEAMLRATADLPVKLLIQLHGHGPYPHSATAAWPLVRDLPPERIGVMMDPGNNVMQEGTEDIDYQFALLREYVGACGVKDAIKIRAGEYPGGGKRWASHAVPVGEGFNDWERVLSNLLRVAPGAPLVFMPFYSTEDAAAHCETLKKEVAYINGFIKRCAQRDLP